MGTLKKKFKISWVAWVFLGWATLVWGDLQPFKMHPILEKPCVFQNHYCEKSLLLNEKKYSWDDISGSASLRAVLEDTPQSLKEFDLYQKSKSHVMRASMFETLGIVVGLAGLIFDSSPFTAESGGWRFGGYCIVFGFGLTLNALLYSWLHHARGEQHLKNALESYLFAHPQANFELTF